MSDPVRELEQKVIVVTGAGSGIGRALVLHAASRGMRVVLADIDAARLAQVLDEVRTRGADAIGVETDVASAASVQNLAERAYEAFGAVHVLVNNAGIALAGAAWTVPLETWQKVLDINLNGVIHGVHSFVPRMLAGGQGGHVVNVASAAGLISVPGFAPYSASKFAVVGLSEALQHDLRLRQLPIAVTVVCPSWVQTSIARSGALPPGSDQFDANVGAAVGKAVAHGISAESVAERVFEAIEEGQFYVLTHEDTRRAVQARHEDLLAGRAPAMAAFDRKKS